MAKTYISDSQLSVKICPGKTIKKQDNGRGDKKLKEIYIQFGLPDIIQHDKGSEFTSKVGIH